MKNRVLVRLVTAVFVLAVVFAVPVAAFALPCDADPAPVLLQNAQSSEPAEDESSPPAGEEEPDTVTVEEEQTPEAMPMPEESVHVGYPSSILFTFLAVLVVVVLVRMLVRRDARKNSERNETGMQ